MKKLFWLIVLGAAAWAGYRYWWLPRQEQAAGEQQQAEQQSDQATADAISAAVGLPEQLAELRAEADAQWQAIEAEGKDPTLAEQAPVIARAYSTVLQGTYEHEGMQDTQQQLIEERLHPLAERLFFSQKIYRDDPSGFFAAHTIAQGERLQDLGRDYGLSYQHINIMRGVEPESGQYREGATIKVYRGKDERFGGFLLHIDKSEFFMDVYLGGIFARRYPVGLGAPETPTPSGTTRIVGRVRDPQWTDPKTGIVHEAGDPGNILGGVWLPFDAVMLGANGLGIHGYTGDGPATGALVSNGCIRMRNEDAVELYNLTVPTAGDPQSPDFISRVPMRVEIVE